MDNIESNKIDDVVVNNGDIVNKSITKKKKKAKYDVNYITTRRRNDPEFRDKLRTNAKKYYKTHTHDIPTHDIPSE